MPVRDYRSDLLVKLANPEFAALYLQAALDEARNDGDRESFRLALKDVVDARQSTQEVARQTETLDKRIRQALEEDNPTLETLFSVLNAAGLTVEFKPA